MKKVDSKRMNGYYITRSGIWDLALKIKPSLYDDYKSLLMEKASARDIETILNWLWVEVHKAIVTGRPEMSMFFRLPVEVVFSRVCVDFLQKRPEYIQFVLAGEVSANMLKRIAVMNGVWK